MTLSDVPEGAYEIKMSIHNKCGSSGYVSETIANFPEPPTLNIVHVPEDVDPLIGNYPCGITVYWSDPAQ
jgi:hypothetical protein